MRPTPSPPPTTDALERYVRETPPLDVLLDEARERLDDDPGHDLAHAMRVALWTLRLSSGLVDPRLAVAAALFHDVVNIPKDHPDRALASVRSAALASTLLETHGFDADERTLVCDAIRDHAYSRGAIPSSHLGKALQDADRLEALGVLGVFRTISTGARMGSRYFAPDDPWAERRALDDKAYSVDHFFTKLLHLEATMQTDGGRAEAKRRTARMRVILEDLGDELGRPLPASR